MNDHTSTASANGVLACQLSEVPQDGTVLVVTLAGLSIAIAQRSQHDDTLVAFDSHCPHMQGPLGFGRVVQGQVICPWHFMRFDTATGRTVQCDNSSMSLRTYPLRVSDGGVYVQVGS